MKRYNMKKIWLLIILMPLLSFAQFGGDNILQPLTWKTSIEKTGADTYNLIFEADIEKDWHLYSQFNDPMGSLPIEFEWKNAKNNYEVIGKAKEIGTHKLYNKTFKVTETLFSNHAKLIQPIKLINKNLKTINVVLTGQACKEACIQVEEKFSFDLSKAKEVTVQVAKKSTDNTKTDTPVKKNNEAIKLNDPKKESTKTETKPQKNQIIKKDITENGKFVDVQQPISKEKREKIREKNNAKKLQSATPKGLWNVFWFAFIAGLLVLLTPCIFPMIPLTISFFTKHSEKSSKGKMDAFVYAISIILIYVLFSLPFHLFKADSSFLNQIATNTYVNLFFFIIFMLFALNLFGVEKLDPTRIFPSSWVNSADTKANKGGILAGFFMALTLVIVSFSCTGPALGLLLGNTLTSPDGPMRLSIAMFGFGLGMALPFGLFALFPSLLKKLPQSGSWLNSVKVVFGFIELAFAFKFLSNADLTNQWHFLHREMFYAIWIAIAISMSMYLFGKIRFSHDAPVERIGVFRFFLGLSSLVFGIYLLPGLWGAPTNIISGFPPPSKYAESPFGVGYTKHNTQGSKEILPEGAEFGHNNLIIFKNDYDKALAYAKKMHKPLLLDFTGWNCQNCRSMEENVWSKAEISSLMHDNFVIASLYVDDKRDLPKSEKYISEYTGDSVTTIGKKWTELETFKYKSNSQPFYIILDNNENIMNTPVGNTPDVAAYHQWLKEGLDQFNKK